jgi:hypothetical protein
VSHPHGDPRDPETPEPAPREEAGSVDASDEGPGDDVAEPT